MIFSHSDLVLNECTKHFEYANRLLLLSSPLPPHHKELLSLCHFIAPNQGKAYIDMLGMDWLGLGLGLLVVLFISLYCIALSPFHSSFAGEKPLGDDLKAMDYPFAPAPSLGCLASDEAKCGELQGLIGPCFLRRTRQMVQDMQANAMDVEADPCRDEVLGPAEEKVLLMELSKQQRDYYKWILRKNFNEINKAAQRGIRNFVYFVLVCLLLFIVVYCRRSRFLL
jgi:hypothetical protein